MSEWVGDARVRLVRGYGPGGEPIAALLIKRAYRFAPGVVEVVEPGAWVVEQVVEGLGDRPGTVLRRDCELFAYKELTDVVVQGHVVAPGERAVTRLWASVQVGGHGKGVLVFGDRHVEGGRVSGPAPFVRMPLCWSRAYGGIDSGIVEAGEPRTVGELVRCLSPETHPGAYPRNPVGAGWLIRRDPRLLEGLALPNFEAAGRRLASESLIVGDPRLWSLAPEPQGFGWVHAGWYPRCAFLGLLPREAPLDDHEGMPEVHAGWIPRGNSRRVDALAPEARIDLRYSNGAAAGLRLCVRGGEVVSLVGFMPEGEIVFSLPGAPGPVELFLRGRELAVELALHTLLIEPDERRLTMIWAARARTGEVLPRRLPELDVGVFDPNEDLVALLDGELVPHQPEALQ